MLGLFLTTTRAISNRRYGRTEFASWGTNHTLLETNFKHSCCIQLQHDISRNKAPSASSTVKTW